MTRSPQAVLLIGFGGPAKMEDVRPFLDNVLRGHPVPPGRYEEVVKQYERIGGASPYYALTLRLASALAEQLKKEGTELPVYVGMRNWSPYLGDVLKQMAGDGFREAAGVVLSSFRSEPSWDRYVRFVEESRRSLGEKAPRVKYADPWYEDPLFVQAVTDRIGETQDVLSPQRRKDAHWVFTAHSIPLPADRSSGYSLQIARSAELCARLSGREKWRVAYQSRSGRPEDPWLEPDVGDVLRELAGSEHKDVLVIPLGFLTDHVEVLFDLDIKARRAADEAGINFFRVKTVGPHPSFVRVLSSRVRGALGIRESARA